MRLTVNYQQQIFPTQNNNGGHQAGRQKQLRHRHIREMVLVLRCGLSSGGLGRKQAFAQVPPHYLRTSLPLRKRRRFLNFARV